MRASLAVCIVILSALPFFAGAQTGVPCNQFQSGSAPPAGYGASWNVLSSARELMIYATCNSGSTTFTIGTGASNQYVFKLEYGFSKSVGSWQQYPLTGTLVQGSTDWLAGKGSWTSESRIVSDPLYWVGYVCQFVNNAWKCGCRDAACTTNYWQLQASSDPFSSGTTGGTTGGSTGGTTGPSGATPCANPQTFNVNPSNIKSTLAGAGPCVILNMAPGDYPGIHHDPPQTGGITFKCTVAASLSGPACRATVLTLSGMSYGAVENMVFIARTADGDLSTPSTDYAIPVFGVKTVRVANNIFNGYYNHEVSTKESVQYAEILDNRFINCKANCIEAGQEPNRDGKNKQTGTVIVRGNTISSQKNGIVNINGTDVRVENNTFSSVGSYAVWNHTYFNYHTSTGCHSEGCPQIPTGTLTTKVTGNTFSGGGAKLRFEGRGSNSDTVLVKGNSSVSACNRTSMDSKTVPNYTNEQTTAPPKLDTASDVSC